MQEKDSIINERYEQTNLSLGSLFGITRQSLVMPKLLPLGQICLSIPHTHVRFLYSMPCFGFIQVTCNKFLLRASDLQALSFIRNAIQDTVQAMKNIDRLTDNMPMQYTAIFHDCKNGNFSVKKSNIFLIFAQNIDRGYTLEPPHQQSMFNSKNKKIIYTPVNPSYSI